jgi:hypothetical protein
MDGHVGKPIQLGELLMVLATASARGQDETMTFQTPLRSSGS